MDTKIKSINKNMFANALDCLNVNPKKTTWQTVVEGLTFGEELRKLAQAGK